MDIKKLNDGIAALKAIVNDAVKAGAGVLVDGKSTQQAKDDASRSLNALGKISGILNKAEERIASAVERSQPKAKKMRKKKTA